MAGTFTIGQTKARPGIYWRRENAGGVSLAGAINGIGVGLIRANWGPLNKAVDFEPNTDVKKIFGSGNTEDLITEMFNGGISSGKFVRIGKGGTAPSVKLTLADGTTEAGTITGAYVGNRAFTITIRNSITSDKREAIIHEGESEFVKVEYAAGDNEIAALEAALKAATKDFTFKASAGVTGALADVVQKAFTAGTNPTTSTEEYAAGLTALEATTYNVLCVDTEEPAVHLLVAAFLNRTLAAGAFPMASIAETKAVELETRMQHAAAFNDEKIIYSLNPATDSAGKEYDGYRLAARIGGIIASVPSNQSTTHEVVSGFPSVAEPLTNTQIEKALGSGCLVLSENAKGQVWVEQGINTLITPSADMDEGWKKIRRVKTRFEVMQRVTDTTEPLIGKVNNDTDGRAAIIAAAQGVVNTMAREKKILDTSEVYEDPNYPAQGDSAWFIIAVDDIDSIERIYLTFRFRFAPETAAA